MKEHNNNLNLGKITTVIERINDFQPKENRMVVKGVDIEDQAEVADENI